MKYRRKVKREKQRSGLPNSYDFTYIERETVNTRHTMFQRIVPFLIKATINQVNRITETTTKREKESERNEPKIMRQVIEKL